MAFQVSIAIQQRQFQAITMNHVQTHLRVVLALLAREMSTRFGSKPGGYIWALLDPVAHILLMTAIFQAVARLPALGTSFTLFFATGYIAFQFYQAMTSYVNSAVRANRALLNYPNVAPIDTVIARSLLQFGTTSLVGLLVLGVLVANDGRHQNLDWIAISEAIGLASILGVGMSLINCVLFTKYPIYEQTFTIINRPLFLVSGVFFLPDSLPQPYKDLILMNPLAHIVMLFRQGFYAEYRATGLNMMYVYSFSLFTFLLGLALFTFSSRLLRNA